MIDAKRKIVAHQFRALAMRFTPPRIGARIRMIAVAVNIEPLGIYLNQSSRRPLAPCNPARNAGQAAMI